ncbi:peptidoglycan-binding protein [Streptomyces sp. TRM66268-LWL]|uniref:Peptidoglycan-binding protein n=1 Tax=Streptomyces polyasparticus TaxID=2767826 RepID=A0ABR7SN58_9ACTN|nr:peptidoglycan-binding domain-containing protein [Streptomyces polyasparticus]MBC9716007.1 peptidoglycan-binding protein [Streptomyces polyasparticus]
MRAFRPRSLAASLALATAVLAPTIALAAPASAATVGTTAITCTIEDFIGIYCGYHYWNTYADRGDTGAKVKEIQALLTLRGYSVGSSGIDGQFGAATEGAVKRFQSNNRLGVDGIVGPKTWEALRMP